VLIGLSEPSDCITYNVLRLGEGCLTESSKFAECLWQLLPNRCYVLGGLSALKLILKQNENNH
jgi:hypothetical protein